LSRTEFSACISAYDAGYQIDILEYKVILAAMAMFEEYECDTRIVFWFDL